MQLQAYPTDIIQEFVDRLRGGASIKMACDSTGLARSDYYEWLKLAKHKEARQRQVEKSELENPTLENAEEIQTLKNHPFVVFAATVRKAQAEFRWSLVKEIKATDPKQWQARAWLLERTEPELYSEKFRLKKYPEYLLDKPYAEQGNEIFKLLVNGEISLHEAHLFVETLAKLANVEEVTRLKEQLFEITEKMKC